MKRRCPACKIMFDHTATCPSCGRTVPLVRPSILILAVMTLFVVGVPVLRAVSRRFGEPIVASVLRTLPGPATYEVGVRPPAVPVPTPSRPMLSGEEWRRLRDMLEKEDFRALDETLTALQLALEGDMSYEFKVADAFSAVALPGDGARLDRWVRHDPSRFAPYLARAGFYFDQGQRARGTDWASNTSEQRFRAMNAAFEKAAKDVDAALAINPRLLEAYVLRIWMANAGGTESEEDAAFDAARALFPESFDLYDQMTFASLPRWGGSYEKMERVAKLGVEAGQAKDRPARYALFGRIYLDQADLLRRQKRYDQALAMDTKALAYGERTSFFVDRAKTLCYLEQYERALKDLDRAISLYPGSEAYRLRGFVRRQLREPELAYADVRKAIELDERSFDAYKELDRLLLSQGRLDEIIEAWTRYLSLEPDDAEAYLERAGTYQRKGDMTHALEDLRKSADLGNSEAAKILKQEQ